MENGGKKVEKLCKRCKQTYDVALNNPLSCRFHPSFFVSRRHDDQRRYGSSVGHRLEYRRIFSPGVLDMVHRTLVYIEGKK